MANKGHYYDSITYDIVLCYIYKYYGIILKNVSHPSNTRPFTASHCNFLSGITRSTLSRLILFHLGNKKQSFKNKCKIEM